MTKKAKNAVLAFTFIMGIIEKVMSINLTTTTDLPQNINTTMKLYRPVAILKPQTETMIIWIALGFRLIL